MICPNRLTKLTQKILSINSENPPGREKELGLFIEKYFRDLGLSVKTHAFAKDRPNIIAVLKGTLPRIQAAARSILITPHYDTVPIGEGWTKDPFGRDIVNGRIYGRGASDDKGNTAAAMEVACSLVEQGIRLRHDLVFAVTADEETGSHFGIVPLLDKQILKPGYAVILDSDDCHAIVAQKGLIHFRVQIFGKRAHGAYNWLGKNAIETAARVIQRLKAHRFSFERHPLLRPPTLNVGTIRGGDKVNMVADFCEFSLDIRFLRGMTHARILNEVRAIIRKETSRFKILIDDVQQPYDISQTHPLVRTYLQEARALKIPVKVKGSEGATVMTFFKRHRIPAFATGFGTKGNAHTTDEYAELSTLIKGARLLERYLISLDKAVK